MITSVNNTLSLQVVATSDVFNYISINSLWELLAEDCKIIFGNAYGEVDPYNRATCGTCVCREKGKAALRGYHLGIIQCFEHS